MDKNKNFSQNQNAEVHGVSITSVDILQQKFRVKLRGYDIQDVDAFLELVSREMERLGNETARQQEEIASLRHKVDLYKKKEESINAALVTVQKLADDVKSRALKDSEKLLAESRAEAEQVLAESKTEAESKASEAERKLASADSDIKQLKEQARREAEQMLDETRREIEQTRADFRMEHETLKEQFNELKQQKLQFQVSLKALIDTHLKLLENEK